MSNIFREYWEELHEEADLISCTFEEHMQDKINNLRMFTFPLTKADLKLLLDAS